MKTENYKISKSKAISTFLFSNKACSGTLFHILNNAYDNPLKLEENASMLFAGGIMQNGYQCGQIWGATLAAGAQSYKLFGKGELSETKALLAANRLVASFNEINHQTNCLELTGLDKSSSTMKMISYFLIKGGTISCIKMAVKYSQVAYNEINSVLSENVIKMPTNQVNCASLLAKKLGMTDAHQTIVAGFAGGIGLCGGACGALAAAIWNIAMKDNPNGDKKIEYKNKQASEIIDNFLNCSDYKFECSEIVGRKFESIEDHTAYLNSGGCSKLIDLLSSI